jgi:hypothetical protein
MDLRVLVIDDQVLGSCVVRDRGGVLPRLAASRVLHRAVAVWLYPEGRLNGSSLFFNQKISTGVANAFWLFGWGYRRGHQPALSQDLHPRWDDIAELADVAIMFARSCSDRPIWAKAAWDVVNWEPRLITPLADPPAMRSCESLPPERDRAAPGWRSSAVGAVHHSDGRQTRTCRAQLPSRRWCRHARLPAKWRALLWFIALTITCPEHATERISRRASAVSISECPNEAADYSVHVTTASASSRRRHQRRRDAAQDVRRRDERRPTLAVDRQYGRQADR